MNFLKFLTVCVILIEHNRPIICDYVYTSVANMEKLLVTQAWLIKYIKTYLNLVRSEDRRIVLKYLENLQRENTNSAQNQEHYLGNPINVYTMITRLYRDLKQVEKILNRTHAYSRRADLVYPTEDDLLGSMDGLARVLLVYNLDVTHLASGILMGNYSKDGQLPFIEYVTPMSAADCFELGVHEYDKKRLSRSMRWHEEAYERYTADPDFCDFTEIQLLELIALQNYKTGNYEKALHWIKKQVAYNPKSERAKVKMEYMSDLVGIRGKIDKAIEKPKKLLMLNTVEFLSLCRGHQTYNVHPSLSCHYAHGPHPFLVLAPVKAEVLHRDPDVIMFYDVISDGLIRKLKQYVKPILKPSLTQKTYLTSKMSIRVNDDAWLPDSIPEGSALSRLAHDVTGLKVTQTLDVPMTRAINYGIGGYVNPHYDILGLSRYRYSKKSNVLFERQATVVFYLSEVRQGGATIFPHLRLTVYPVKNAALFWTNLDPWGRRDLRSRHGACPVLRGSKWVAVRWIPHRGQESTCPGQPGPDAAEFELR